jgi:hypothetical protein
VSKFVTEQIVEAEPVSEPLASPIESTVVPEVTAVPSTPADFSPYSIVELDNGAFAVRCVTPGHTAVLADYLIHDIGITCMATPDRHIRFALNEDGEFPAIAREVVETFIATTYCGL